MNKRARKALIIKQSQLMNGRYIEVELKDTGYVESSVLIIEKRPHLDGGWMVCNVVCEDPSLRFVKVRMAFDLAIDHPPWSNRGYWSVDNLHRNGIVMVFKYSTELFHLLKSMDNHTFIEWLLNRKLTGRESAQVGYRRI